MSPIVLNRIALAIIAKQLRRTTAAVDEAAVGYVVARERFEAAYAEHLVWAELGEQVTRLPLFDAVTDMLSAVRRCKARIEAARAGESAA